MFETQGHAENEIQLIDTTVGLIYGQGALVLHLAFLITSIVIMNFEKPRSVHNVNIPICYEKNFTIPDEAAPKPKEWPLKTMPRDELMWAFHEFLQLHVVCVVAQTLA